eukprot:3253273-Amphidinium_carterae.1
MGKLSGSKFQSPSMKICRFPSAATAAKISIQTSLLSSWARSLSELYPYTLNTCSPPSKGKRWCAQRPWSQ